MSGASGKVLAAIHLTPEAANGGPIARLADGDIVRIDAVEGHLDLVGDLAAFERRRPVRMDAAVGGSGFGRELFGVFRNGVGSAEEGATVLPALPSDEVGA
jgi:phosphogluconate dehydratase